METDLLKDAAELLSTRKVQLDVGRDHYGTRFWRFIFNGKPLICVFADGVVLVDIKAKMSKTRRNYFLRFEE